MLKLATDVLEMGPPAKQLFETLTLSELCVIRGLLVSFEGSVNWFVIAPILAKVDAEIARRLPTATFEYADRTPLRMTDMSPEQQDRAINDWQHDVRQRAALAASSVETPEPFEQV